MPTELVSPDLVHTVDAIGLPSEDEPVEGRSARRDAYPIFVTSSLAEAVERLLGLIGKARVAILTDSTVMELYGATVVRALDGAGLEPEVAVVSAGERHKTLAQAFELLDWLTGTQKAAFVNGAVFRIDGGELA